jgi:CrcB protein
VTFRNILFVALGGLIGTLARFATGTVLKSPSARYEFPFGTLAVNLVGCFIMGFLQGYFVDRVIREEYRLGWLVGFLGGYTTFSSYGWETTAFLRDRQYLMAALNLGANNILGIPLVILGYLLGRRI